MHAPKTHIEGRGVICKNCGMITSGMPASLNLSVVAGKEHVYEFEARRIDGEEIDMRFCTFSGSVRDNKGQETELQVSLQEGTQNVILAAIPALEEGEYDWALSCTYDNGTSDVLISGILGVFWSNLRISEQVAASPNRRCVFRWAGESVSAQWQQSNYIDQALKEADNALEEVNKGVRIVQSFIALFDNKFSSAVYVDPNTGHLIIGGKDSGVKVPGDNGKSPYIDNLGHWQFWDEVNGKWVDGGLANGRDGRDGTSIKRVLVERFEDIPQSGDTCNGGYLYYVPYENTRFVANKGEKVKIKLSGVYAGPDGSDLFLNGVQVVIMGYGEQWKNDLECSVNQMYSKYSGVDYTLYAGTYDVAFAWSGKLLDEDTLELEALRDGAEVEVSANSKYFELAAGVYHIYAWLEPDGWVRVDEKQDIATEDIYGLMKYGTDAVIEGGAPVGKDAEGRATVSAATEANAGVVKVVSGYNPAPGEGALVCVNSDGLLCVPYGDGAVEAKFANASDADVMDVIRQLGTSELGVFTATSKNYGVVQFALSADDDSGKAVTVKVLNDALVSFKTKELSSYRTKEDSYSKTELYAKTVLYTKTEVDKLVQNAKDESKTCVKQGMGACKAINVVSFAEFDSLVRDPEQIYLVKR